MKTPDNYSIDEELQPNESVIWKGKPAQGLKLRGSDAFLIPFSLLWGGFAIFWEITTINQISKNQPLGFIFPLFGIPFVLAGLYLIFGRFFADAKIREKTEYAITNHRVIIKSGIFSRKVKTINLVNLPETSITEKSDGSGTITFGQSVLPWGAMRGFYWPGISNMQSPALEMVGEVRSVYELILKEQRQ